MASRISHRSRRSSRSRSRLTLKRATGTAAEARIARIATVTINSIKVRPRSERFRIGRWLLIGPLLHRNGRLRAFALHRLLCAVHGARTRDADWSASRSLGLKRKDTNHACSAHADCSRRPRRIDDDRAGTVVAMHQRHRLAVTPKEVAIAYVDQRQL